MQRPYFNTIFLLLCLSLATVPLAQAENARLIKIDASRTIGPMTHMPQLCVGSGYAPLGLRADWQQHLKVAKQACDFKYVRFHAIFHDAMGIFNTTIPFEGIDPKYLSSNDNGQEKVGLKAEYFPNDNLEGKPAVVRHDKSIDFTWNNSAPTEGVDQNHFSVRWTGKLTAPVSGFYKIGVKGDDGVRLSINGELLAQDWTTHPLQLSDSGYHFEKGKQYDIKIEYFQGEGDAEVSLVWSVPWKGPINIYNWQYVDQLYDYLLSQGVKPFVELSFMPKELASNQPGADGRTTVFWYEGNVTPPKSYDDWAHLIRAFVSHLTDRYGEEEVRSWYFEVWNEPNHPLFWTADLNEYLKLYDTTARAVKSINAAYRVGGPATAGNGWVREILDFCDKQNTPIDFIATHCYGVEWGFLDESGRAELSMSPSRNRIIDQVREVRKWIESTKYAGLELHYTEWSSSYSSRDPVHDSYHSAAYILHKLKGTDDYADSMSYWTFTDVFEEAGPGPSPFHGGFGLQNLQGLRKPSFYAYKYFNDLGDTEIACNDADTWATKEGDDIQVLFWDFTVTQQDASNKVYFKRDLPAANAGKTTLEISNLVEGEYKLNIYKVGYRVNDVYTDFYDMGSPAAPTQEQVEQLASQNDGSAIETARVTVGEDGIFSKEFDLRENDVLLMTLTKQ